MSHGFEKQPTRGDEVFFVYELLDEEGQADEWRVAHKNTDGKFAGFVVEDIIYAPTGEDISSSSSSECLPYYILRGVPKGLVIDHADIFPSLDQAQFECEVRGLFPQ